MPLYLPGMSHCVLVFMVLLVVLPFCIIIVGFVILAMVIVVS